MIKHFHQNCNNGMMGRMVLLPNWVRRLFWKGRWGKRVVLGAILTLALAFFLHYREVIVDNLELNTVAEKYMLAQVGFEFPDGEATALLKQESMRDVGKICHLDDTQVFHWNDEIEKKLVNDTSWRDRFASVTFEGMYDAKERVRDALLKGSFADVRTIQKMEEIGFPHEGYHRSPGELFEAASPEMEYILDTVRKEKWNLYDNLDAQNALRQAVRASVPAKHTKVEAGSRIINAGEKVTPRHLEMVKAMKKVISEHRNQLTPMTLFGSLLMAFLFVMLSLIYIRVQHPAIVRSFQKIALLTTILILTMILAKVTEYVVVNKSGQLLEVVRYPIFVLFCTLLVSLLVGREVALIVSCLVAVVLGISLAIDYDHFLVINIIAAIVAIISVRKIRRRKEIFEACAKVWLSLIPVIIAFNLFENTFWNFHLVTDLVSTFFFVGGTAIGVVGLLPILEAAFDIVTDMTLMEYVDPNHPLPLRLSAETPGTYQHSLVVGALSEAAALSIGANGLFCRVATLYHDIGKLHNSHYSTENQQGGFNIHHLLTPQESAEVIIGHITYGVMLAEKYRLPLAFIDIIREHHGTSAVYCFYRAELALVGGDQALVDEQAFRYKGPKPRTKESAIIMVGDCIEAAFRCLDEATEAVVTAMVDRLVLERIQDGQLDECQLTFEELGKIKQAMVRTLLATSHARVKYPEREAAKAPHSEALFAGRL